VDVRSSKAQQEAVRRTNRARDLSKIITFESVVVDLLGIQCVLELIPSLTEYLICPLLMNMENTYVILGDLIHRNNLLRQMMQTINVTRTSKQTLLCQKIEVISELQLPVLVL
jgi:hypothetical protein